MTDIRPLIALGGNVTGASLAGFVIRHLDQFLIGWYWGPAALGFYERAYKLLLVPVNNINALFTVLMQALSG
ncbi:MAG: oligosaccharide flippase family protein [Alphaproteobacteria bacterium]